MNLSEITNPPVKTKVNREDVLLVPEPPGEKKHWRDTATTFFGGKNVFPRKNPEKPRSRKSAILATSRSFTKLENIIPKKGVKYFHSKSTPIPAIPVVLGKSQGFIQQPQASLRVINGTSKKKVEDTPVKILRVNDNEAVDPKTTELEVLELNVDSLKLQPGNTSHPKQSISPSILTGKVLQTRTSANLSKHSSSLQLSPKSNAVEEEHLSSSPSRNSNITGNESVATECAVSSETVTEVSNPGNHLLNQEKNIGINDGFRLKTGEASDQESHLINALPDLIDSVEDLQKNPFEPVECVLKTPPPESSNFSGFHSTGEKSLKSSIFLDDPKPGTVVDKRLVCANGIWSPKLKFEGAAAHTVSSNLKVPKDVAVRNSTPLVFSPSGKESTVNVNKLEPLERESVSNDSNTDVNPTTFPIDSSIFSDSQLERTGPIGNEIRSSSLLEYIVDQTQLSNTSLLSSPQARSVDSQQLTNIALSDQALNPDLLELHKITRLPAFDCRSSESHAEDENEKEVELTDIKDSDKDNNFVEKTVNNPAIELKLLPAEGVHALNPDLPETHKITALPAFDYRSSEISAQNENEKEGELKNIKDSDKVNDLVEKIVNNPPKELRLLPGKGVHDPTLDHANSVLSTNPFENCMTLNSTNPFDSCESPVENLDLSKVKVPGENLNMQIPSVEIDEIDECSVDKLRTTASDKLPSPKGDMDKRLKQCQSGTYVNRIPNEPTDNIPASVTGCKSSTVRETEESKDLGHVDESLLMTEQTLLNDSPIKTEMKQLTETESAKNICSQPSDRGIKYPLVSVIQNFSICHPDLKTHLINEVFPYGNILLFLGKDDNYRRESLRLLCESKFEKPRNKNNHDGCSIPRLTSPKLGDTLTESQNLGDGRNTSKVNRQSSDIFKSFVPTYTNENPRQQLTYHKCSKQDINLYNHEDSYHLKISEIFECNMIEKEKPFVVDLSLCFRNLKSTSEECLNQCTISLVKALRSRLCSSESYTIKINEIIATDVYSSDKNLFVLNFKIFLDYNAEAEWLKTDLRETFFQEELQKMIEENLNERIEFHLEKVEVHSVLEVDLLRGDGAQNYSNNFLSMCSKMFRGFGVVTNIVKSQTIWEQPNTLFSLLCFWLALFNMKKGFFYGMIIYNSEFLNQGAIANAIGITFLLISCSRYGIFFYLSRANNELALRLPANVFCLDQALFVIGYSLVTFGDTILALTHWNTTETLPDTHWHTLLQPSLSANMNISRAIQFWPLVIYSWMTLILIGRRAGTITIQWFTVSISLVFQSAVFFPSSRDLLVWFMFTSLRFNIWTTLGLLGSSLKIIAVLMSMHVQIMGTLNHPSLKYIFYPYSIIFLSGSLLNNLAFSMYTISHLASDVALCAHMLLDVFLSLAFDFLAFAGILLIFRLSDSNRRRRFQIKNSSITCDVVCKRQNLSHAVSKRQNLSNASEAAAVVVAINDL